MNQNSEGGSIVSSIKLSNTRSIPEALIILIKHIIRDKGGPTKWASFLIMIDPTVHTSPVENVLAVPQAPDLLLLGEFEQAHRAVPLLPLCLAEPRHRQQLPDQDRRHGGGPRRVGWKSGSIRVRPGNLGFEEVGEAEEAEEEEDEVSEMAEES